MNHRLWEKGKIDSSSHKIWGLNWTGHNAYFLGKPLRGLSAQVISIETTPSSTELPTEAVEQNLCKKKKAIETDGTGRTS